MDTLQAILAIVLIDLTLSGDNALVIGMAARNLPPKQRRQAIILGGAAAIVLLVIAYRLVQQGESQHGTKVRAAGGLGSAIVTILAADAAMSLENILGVGAAAHSNVILLVFGLALSIPIVLFGSAMVVGLLQ